MEKIYNIIKPSVDGLTNAFDNDNIENNQDSYCENGNDMETSNNNSNTTMVDYLFDETCSSDTEDCVLKYVNTTQETPEFAESSFPGTASIKKKQLYRTKKDTFDENMSFKQNSQKNKQHINLQFQNTCNFNKNSNIPEEKNGPSKPINSSEQLQDITNCETSSEENECIDKDDLRITQRKIVNTGTKVKEKTALNILTKKISKPLQIRRENVQFNSDCAKTFPQTRKNYSTSDKVLNFATLANSKAELVELMKMDINKKHEIEVNILNMQLHKETLQAQLIEKEIAIKEYILERLKKTDALEDIENM
ncbi:unnamed protein product [Lasius platythorax]|uniref:Uncharacterized protein n=1 Tax=Lasius platythorax TaxID=488582 RepID=A0AAV2P0L5_9HYME